MVLCDTRQLVLAMPKQEEVWQCQIRQIGRVAEDLDAVGGEPILDDGSGVNRGVVSIEKPLLLHQHMPLLPQMLHEDIQDLDDIRGVDGGATGDDV